MHAPALLIAVAALALTPAAAQTVSKREGEILHRPPLALYLAKGEPDACGPGCSEWIAAEGMIDRGAAERFRTFLQRLGQRKLPVYFHSPGGALSNATAIGRLMRQRGMTAGVARTIPQGCNALLEREDACDKLKRSGRQLSAELRSARALCGSACVYALVGAKVRLVPSGARLGAHASVLARCDKRGCVRLASSTKMTRQQRSKIQTDAAELARYFRAMGIDTALLDAANEIPHDGLRYLSRDEIARFGIDRREFNESNWMIDEGPPGPFALLKFVTEAAGPDGKEYRTTRIRLTCYGQDQIWIGYDRELASSDAGVAAPISLVARGGNIVFRPRLFVPIMGYNNIPMDGRRERIPISMLEEAAAGDGIEIAEKPERAQSDQRPRVTKISTAGLSQALAALRLRCRGGITL
jgi:hypothetical protein